MLLRGYWAVRFEICKHKKFVWTGSECDELVDEVVIDSAVAEQGSERVAVDADLFGEFAAGVDFVNALHAVYLIQTDQYLGHFFPPFVLMLKS